MTSFRTRLGSAVLSRPRPRASVSGSRKLYKFNREDRSGLGRVCAARFKTMSRRPPRNEWGGPVYRQAPGKRAELALPQCRSGMIDWELPASAR